MDFQFPNGNIQLSLFKNPAFVCGSHCLACSCISSQKADVDSASLLTLPVSSARKHGRWWPPSSVRRKGGDPHDERVASLFFIFHGSERDRVWVWRRGYVTGPGPVPWVRKGRRPRGLFKVMMTALGENSAGRSAVEALGISLHRLLSFLGSYSASPLHRSSSAPPPGLSALSFVTTGAVCAWHRGGECPRFTMPYNNERRRGDSAVSAQRPHLLPFLLLTVSVWISVYLSRMHSAVSARAPARLPTHSA